MRLKLSFLRTIPGEAVVEVIPADLKEAHERLRSLLGEEDLKMLQDAQNESVMVQCHHGIGGWIRNNWGLWKKERLQQWFAQNWGIEHPDDISSVILDTFWCELHKLPFQMDRRAQFYKDYWAAARSKDRHHEIFELKLEKYLGK